MEPQWRDKPLFYNELRNILGGKQMNTRVIRTGIVGISGYSGGITFELLLNHPQVRITYTSANNTRGAVSDIWPQLKGKTSLTCNKYDEKKAIKLCDLVFLAVPHTVAMTIAPNLLKAKIRVIDLSGDYRLETASAYKKWYGADHKDDQNLSKAVYGLPELYREKIKKADLVSNPGCYPTAAILALAPLITIQTEKIESIIIDAKSGVSGAGKKATEALMFARVNENFKAYKVLHHQHTPEIDQYLSFLAEKSVQVTFVPHLLPVNRGILETIYVRLKEKLSPGEIHSMYTKFYKTEEFVRTLPPDTQPELKNVVGTNYCDIGLALSEGGDMLVITSAIDNLLKGAAGGAVQNMNIMYGFKENVGLS